MTDLQDAYNALLAKNSTYLAAQNYYNGNQPTVYSTDRVKEAFGNINAKFVQNWIRVVVDAVLDRLVLSGWNSNDKAANDALDTAWAKLHIFRDALDAHRDALITGEAFIIAWKSDGNAPIDVYWNDAKMCHMFYDTERPKVKRFAAKWWKANDRYYMTLYYPDRLEYYEANTKETPTSAAAFIPMQPDRAPNPYGIIPVFHFNGESELNSIIYLQDSVNKLFADMMVASEFGAFRQRWLIGNFDPATFKNSPYETLILGGGDGQGQDTSVGQFDVTPLSNFLEAIDKVAASIAIISRTPKHYFYNATNSDLSGEALLAMEAPLTKKVRMRQEIFGTTWQELGAFVLRLENGMILDPSDVQPAWYPAESIQPYTQAQTRQLAVSAGIPLVTHLRREEGWQQNELDQMEKDKRAEQDGAMITGQLLLQSMRNQEQTNPRDNGGNSRNRSNDNAEQ